MAEDLEAKKKRLIDATNNPTSAEQLKDVAETILTQERPAKPYSKTLAIQELRQQNLTNLADAMMGQNPPQKAIDDYQNSQNRLAFLQSHIPLWTLLPPAAFIAIFVLIAFMTNSFPFQWAIISFIVCIFSWNKASKMKKEAARIQTQAPLPLPMYANEITDNRFFNNTQYQIKLIFYLAQPDTLQAHPISNIIAIHLREVINQDIQLGQFFSSLEAETNQALPRWRDNLLTSQYLEYAILLKIALPIYEHSLALFRFDISVQTTAKVRSETLAGSPKRRPGYIGSDTNP